MRPASVVARLPTSRRSEANADFRSASTRLEASAGELAKVAADLGATRSETAGRVQGLLDELTRTRQAWAARVAGAGLLTPEQAADKRIEKRTTRPAAEHDDTSRAGVSGEGA